MSNKDVECLLKKEQIYKWQIAEKIGLHETSFCRWWRKELSQEQVQRVLSAVEEIKLDRLEESGQFTRGN